MHAEGYISLPVHAEGYYSIAGAEAPQPSPTILKGGSMATLVPVQRVLIPYPRRGRAGEPDSIRHMGGPQP